MSHKASKALGTPLYSNDKHLSASGNAELDAALKRTYAGQAHLSEGPRHCCECTHYGYACEELDDYGRPTGVTTRRPHACGKVLDLTGKHGKNFPGGALACRHFQKQGT
jgi:hypothetical protein